MTNSIDHNIIHIWTNVIQTVPNFLSPELMKIIAFVIQKVDKAKIRKKVPTAQTCKGKTRGQFGPSELSRTSPS